MLDPNCSVTQLDAEPPKQHAQYDRVNGVVRGRFAAGSLAMAFNNGWGEEAMQALANGRMHSLTIDLTRCEQFGKFNAEDARKLGESLPAELVEIKVASPFLSSLSILHQTR